MDNDFCKISLKKRFMKCKPIYQDICYIFTGSLLFQKIDKNYKRGRPYFENISFEQLQEATSIITDDELNREDMEKLLSKELLLDEYKTKQKQLKFIHATNLNGDDTVKTILTKLCVYCTNEKIKHPHIYAWYEDINSNNCPIGFSYNENIRMDDEFSEDYEDMIDSKFVDLRGTAINIDSISHLLQLFERYRDIQNDTIYFLTINEYITNINLNKDVTLQTIKQDISLSKLYNGLLFKYWPLLKLNPLQIFEKESVTYDKVKSYITTYADGIRHIENIFNKQSIKCDTFKIHLLKINKPCSQNNIIHLSKLFTEFPLSNEYPFIKLVLETHQDTFYKLYKDSVVYEGFQRGKMKHVTKDICHRWSDDYILQTSYGYEYLHSDGNIIIIKIYDKQYDKYCSLVLHMDGNIELIIDEAVIENELQILRLLKLANSLLIFVNKQTMYAFEPIQLFDKDVFTNPYSDTFIDLMNCKIGFDRFKFEDAQQNILPNWFEGFQNYMQNFPMYFRIKDQEETEDGSQKIITRFKRVSNYSDMDKIHSRFSLLYTIDPTREPEVVIEEVSKIFSIEVEEARAEYESWREDLRMKQTADNTYRFNIKSLKEAGPEVIFSYDTDLVIEMKEIKSFVEYRRIIHFIKSMLHSYILHITEKPNTYFENINQKIVTLFEEDIDDVPVQEIQEEEEISVPEPPITDVGEQLVIAGEAEVTQDDIVEDDEDAGSSLDFSDVSSLFDSDEEEPDFDQLGGAKYKTKSYYLNRLKKYDPQLFKFTPKKKPGQKVATGYSRYCTEEKKRIPIAITTEELKKINENKSGDSGRESYSRAITINGRSKDIHYICPVYWDISRNLSIRPEIIQKMSDTEREQLIVPQKFKTGVFETDQYILERSGNYWISAEERVESFQPNWEEKSKLLHPQGYALPCCFNKKIDAETGKIKEKIKGDYISRDDPVTEGKYAHLPEVLESYFQQTNENLQKKTSKGFLKKGVPQNVNKFIFPICPFLEAYNLIQGNNMDVSTFINNEIQSSLENDIFIYQRCPTIIKVFRKSVDKISIEDIDYVIELLEKTTTVSLFSENIVDKLKSSVYEIDISKQYFPIYTQEENYIFNLLISLKNYIDFLHSDNLRDDTYIIPVLNKIYEGTDKDVNIIIFHSVNGSIKLKTVEYTGSNKYCMMYKRDIYYEPILYRDDQIESFLFGPPLIKSNHYGLIMGPLIKTVNQEYKQNISSFETYKKDITSKGTTILGIYIDNYSNVSHIITKKKEIIPITPCEIPKERYMQVFSLFQNTDIEENMVVSWEKGKVNVQGKVLEKPDIESKYVSVIDSEKKKYNLPFHKICFTENCLILPTFTQAEKYLTIYSSICGKIKGINVSNENYILNIILSNGNYIGIRNSLYEKDKVKYPVIGSQNLLMIEKTLCIMDDGFNDCDKYIEYHKYEKYITKLAYYHIIYHLKHNTYNMEGLLQKNNKYKKNETLSFTYTLHKLGENYYNMLKPRQKYDTMDGLIVNIQTFDDTFNKLAIDVPMLQYIHNLLKDDIITVNDKKNKLVPIIDSFFDEIITPIKDDEYEKYKHIQSYYLCSKTDECNYPCRDIQTMCKLSVKYYDNKQKNLSQKIKYKFIDLLCIHGVANIMDIVQERINKKDIEKFTQKNVHLYNYKDFKNNILDFLFIKQNEYINTVSFQEKDIQFIREDKSSSYNITQLFGKNTKVIYSDIKDDFICLSNVINKVFPNSTDEKSLKKQLISIYPEKESLILQKYSLEKQDIQILLQLFEKEGKQLGIIVISESWNPDKEFNESYFKTSNIDILTNFIILYHIKQKDNYIFANILVDKQYYLTLDELILKNDIFRHIL